MILGSVISDLWHKMNRRKKLDNNILPTPLKRRMSSIEKIIAIGTSHGINIFCIFMVLMIHYRTDLVMSVLVAGYASLLAGLCYAELVTQVPKADSAYALTYVFMGEYAAFFVGWVLILARIIGAAFAAKVWSEYVDSLVDGAISDYIGNITGGYTMGEPLADVPDFLASGIYLVLALLLVLGVEYSLMINLLLAIANVIMILCAFILVIYYEDLFNWRTIVNPKAINLYGINFTEEISEKQIKYLKTDLFSFNCVMKSAAVCVYAYIGFDSIAYGKDVEDPQQSISEVMLRSMITIIDGISLDTALTLSILIIPFFGKLEWHHNSEDTNVENVEDSNFFSKAFFFTIYASRNIKWPTYAIRIAGLCGITIIFFGILFSLSRMMYSMANDGLLFGFLDRVNQRTQAPVSNIIITGLFGALIALLFDPHHLIEFMLLGTLLAFTIVAFDVIMLRYVISKEQLSNQLRHTVDIPNSFSSPSTKEADSNNYNNIAKSELLYKKCGKYKSRYDWINDRLKLPLYGSSKYVISISLLVYTAICLFIGRFLRIANDSDKFTQPIYMWLLFAIMLLFSLSRTIEHMKKSPGTLPLMPLIPALSILFNIILMMQLSLMTGIVFAIWTAIGIIYYFLYGIRYSKEATNIPNSSCMTISEAEKGTNE